MKPLHALLGGVALVLGVNVANAQQRPNMPLPPPPKELKTLRFPAPAAKYDQVVQWYLGLIRQFPVRFHAAQADTDLLVLLVKDCASRIEADGIVTQGEHKYCERTILAKAHELMTPYMMQERGDGNARH